MLSVPNTWCWSTAGSAASQTAAAQRGARRSPGIAGVILWCKGYVDAAIQCNTYKELHDFVQFARKPLGFICFLVCVRVLRQGLTMFVALASLKLIV